MHDTLPFFASFAYPHNTVK